MLWPDGAPGRCSMHHPVQLMLCLCDAARQACPCTAPYIPPYVYFSRPPPHAHFPSPLLTRAALCPLLSCVSLPPSSLALCSWPSSHALLLPPLFARTFLSLPPHARCSTLLPPPCTLPCSSMPSDERRGPPPSAAYVCVRVHLQTPPCCRWCWWPSLALPPTRTTSRLWPTRRAWTSCCTSYTTMTCPSSA